MSPDLQTAKGPGLSDPGEPAGHQTIKKPLVLIVEDHDDTRIMLRTLLEMKGCRVAEAGDGLEALRASNREPLELILMDGTLPLLDGLSATRLIRERSSRRVKIVALSGDARPEFHNAALEAGCDDCLTKPIDFVRLEAILGSLFDTTVMAA
jgi:CheY-like chemotaxis protein